MSKFALFLAATVFIAMAYVAGRSGVIPFYGELPNLHQQQAAVSQPTQPPQAQQPQPQPTPTPQPQYNQPQPTQPGAQVTITSQSTTTQTPAQGLFRAVITGKIENYMFQDNACRIPVLVGIEAKFHNDNFPYGTLNNLGIISVDGIIDTGAAQTLIPNWVLQQQGWRPVGQPVWLRGVGSGPLEGYVYYIPSPYIWSDTDRTYVQLRKNTMVEVWGVEGFNQALIGPDILRYCSFNITGNTWVLGVK